MNDTVFIIKTDWKSIFVFLAAVKPVNVVKWTTLKVPLN
jgi:hypothetical protein